MSKLLELLKEREAEIIAMAKEHQEDFGTTDHGYTSYMGELDGIRFAIAAIEEQLP